MVFPPSPNPGFGSPNFAGSSYGSPGFSSSTQPAPILGDSSHSRSPIRTVGPYQLLTQLGNTSQGPVFAARIPGNEAQFALKVFQRQLPPEEVARVRQEIQAVSRLEHPGIVRPVDVGLEQARLYVVYEHVPGPTLQEQLSKNGPLPSDQAARMVADLAEAIHAAHEVGVLHRDLHPGCVVVDSRTGRARVGDFGHPHDLAAGGTQARPTYQAPEQLKGEQVDPRTDVYGLGAILYELLTCMPPFSGLSHEELRQRILAGHPDAPRDLVASVDGSVERVCLKALALAPRKRHATADALSQALRRAADRGAGRASMAVVGGMGLAWFLSLAVVGTWGWREHTDRTATGEELGKALGSLDTARADAAALTTDVERAKADAKLEKDRRVQGDKERDKLRRDLEGAMQRIRQLEGGGAGGQTQVVLPFRGDMPRLVDRVGQDLAMLPGAERLRVRLLISRMAYRPAAQLLEELRKQAPEDEWLLVTAIRCWGQVGDQPRFQALREELERRATPGGPAALYARLLAREGQQSNAQEMGDLLREVRETAARSKAGYLHMVAASVLMQAAQQGQQGALQEALREAELALDLDPLDSEVRQLRAQILMLAFHMSGRRDGELVCRALGEYEVLRDLTHRPSYWFEIGAILGMFRDFSHALAQIEEGTRMADQAGSPVEGVMGRVQMGNLYVLMNNGKGAWDKWQEAAQKSANGPPQALAAAANMVQGLIHLQPQDQEKFVQSCPPNVADVLRKVLEQVRQQQQQRGGGRQPR